MRKHYILGMWCGRGSLRAGNDEPVGTTVISVEGSSSAAQVGLQAGDVILEIDHQPLSGPEEAEALAKTAKNRSVLLRVWSGGRKRYFLVGPEARISATNPLRARL